MPVALQDGIAKTEAALALGAAHHYGIDRLDGDQLSRLQTTSGDSAGEFDSPAVDEAAT